MNTRIIAAFIAVGFLCAAFCSCSFIENKGEVIEADSLWYEAERVELNPFPDDNDVEIYHSLFKYGDNKVSVICQYYDPPAEEEILSENFDESLCHGTELFVFDTYGTIVERTDIQKIIMDNVDPYARIRSFGMSGDKLFILSEYDGDESGDVVSVIEINTGNIIDSFVYSKELMRVLRSVYSEELIIVSDDVFMICDNSSEILLFDKYGNYRLDTTIELFEQEIFFWDAFSDHKGNVLFSCSNTDNTGISIELGSQTINYEVKNFALGDAFGADIADDGQYYSVSNLGVSKYCEENSQFEMMIPSDSFNANLCDFYKLSVLSASEKELLLVNKNAVNPVDGIVAYKLIKADSNPNAGKTKLRVGLFGDYVISPTLGEAIFQYNLMSEDVFASIMLYDYKKNHYDDGDSLEKGRREEATVLMRDILDGKGPDIIVNAFDILELCDEKYLCDLNEIIEKDSLYKNDDYASDVINLSNTDGKLFQMPLKFGTQGLSAPVEYAPSNGIGYTFEEYLSVVSKANNGADCLAYQMERSSYYSLLFTSMYSDFYKNGNWELDCPEYGALADYCKERVPEKCLANWDDDNFVLPEFTVNNPQIEGISSYIANVYPSGSDLYGYPSLNGNHGVMISVSSSAAISSQTGNRAAAWEFIKVMMSYDIQSIEPFYSSINMNVLRDAGKEAVSKHNKAVAAFREMDPKELAKWRSMGNVIYTEEIDDSAIDAYLGLLNKATEVSRVDGQVLLISKEEIQAFYFGQKDFADVVSIMNARIKTYMDEQR